MTTKEKNSKPLFENESEAVPNETQTVTPENDGLYEDYKKMLHNPPHCIVFDKLPDELPKWFIGAKYSFFMALKMNVNIIVQNNVLKPKQYHKLFLINIVQPPEYEDIKVKETARQNNKTISSFMTSNEQREYFIRWNKEKYKDENYSTISEYCKMNSINLIDDILMHSVTAKIDNIRNSKDA